MELIERARGFRDRVAVISGSSSFTYEQLLEASLGVAGRLLGDSGDLNEARVAFIIRPGFDYVKTLWGIWRAGGIAVPLHPGNPLETITYILKDAGALFLIADAGFTDNIREYAEENAIQILENAEFDVSDITLPAIDQSRRAMILYTSGTTGSPKGVVTTHKNIEAQVKSLVEAWEWSPDDHILNILPMHHVHGIINVLSCALWSGATCEFLTGFDAGAVFDVLRRSEVTLFMAVPTIYHKLIAHWETLPEEEQKELYNRLREKRLMVSGSAALPVSVMEKWKMISGQVLLERYGMTEIGMAISNPYRGERKPGHIGQPLPGVNIQLVDESLEPVADGEQGEILVKGENVFKEYWQRPEATEESFVLDKWFKTGDIAIYNTDSYKIVGRSSVDIIKSGGYKISALEIEEVLRRREDIRDCGVVGIPDEEWGELVCAALVPSVGAVIEPKEIDKWIRQMLPAYKIPRKYILVEDLPRNAMGKVTKKELIKQF